MLKITVWILVFLKLCDYAVACICNRFESIWSSKIWAHKIISYYIWQLINDHYVHAERVNRTRIKYQPIQQRVALHWFHSNSCAPLNLSLILNVFVTNSIGIQRSTYTDMRLNECQFIACWGMGYLEHVESMTSKLAIRTGRTTSHFICTCYAVDYVRFLIFWIVQQPALQYYTCTQASRAYNTTNTAFCTILCCTLDTILTHSIT